MVKANNNIWLISPFSICILINVARESNYCKTGCTLFFSKLWERPSVYLETMKATQKMMYVAMLCSDSSTVFLQVSKLCLSTLILLVGTIQRMEQVRHRLQNLETYVKDPN